MGLYNANQVLKGARNSGGLKTYNQCSVIDVPTAAIAGTTITFTDGKLEIEGKDYAIPASFDFAPINALLKPAQYILSAVPAFLEPADQPTAIAAGVNYTVTPTSLKESVLNYFLNPAAIAALNAQGGYDAVYERVYIGTATDADYRAYSFYSSEEEKLADPRYTGQRVPITGVKFVLTEITPQDNSSKSNALATYTYNDFTKFRATQGDIPAELKVFDSATAVSTYETPAKTYLVKRIFGYTSLANANANINPVELAIYNVSNQNQLLPTPFSTPVKIITGTPVTGLTHFVVYEYYYPSYIEPGNEGTKDKNLSDLTIRDAAILGRINPIYLDNPFNVQRSAMMQAKARPALTLYNNPCSLVKVNVTGVGPVTLSNLTPFYDKLIG